MALVSKNPQRQAGKVELLPGLKLWRVVDVTAEDYKGYDVDARVVLDGDRFTATEVRVRQRPGGPPVNGEALRQVALTGFITNAIGANTTLPPRMPGETYTVIAWGLLEPDDVERMRAAERVAAALAGPGHRMADHPARHPRLTPQSQTANRKLQIAN